MFDYIGHLVCNPVLDYYRNKSLINQRELFHYFPFFQADINLTFASLMAFSSIRNSVNGKDIPIFCCHFILLTRVSPEGNNLTLKKEKKPPWSQTASLLSSLTCAKYSGILPKIAM